MGRAGWGRGTRVGATFYTNLNSFVQLTPNTDESDPCFNDVFYLVSTLEVRQLGLDYFGKFLNDLGDRFLGTKFEDLS